MLSILGTQTPRVSSLGSSYVISRGGRARKIMQTFIAEVSVQAAIIDDKLLLYELFMKRSSRRSTVQ